MKQSFFLKQLIPLIFIICLSFFAVSPLLSPGFFSVHDNAQPQRVFEMSQSLHDGMFPVRWTKDMGFGYGYPLFNFYAPLAYYIGGLFILLNFNVLVATKLMIGIGILLSGVFMYLFAKEFWGRAGGIISALLYVYAPYHAVDIYVRGDVAEMWGYAFIPLAFWGFYKIFQDIKNLNIKNKNDKEKIKSSRLWLWVCIASLGFAGIILSHNLTAMMVTPFLLATVLIYAGACLQPASKRFLNLYALRYTLYAFLLGLALSAFYWLPVFAEMKYTDVLSQTGGGFDFHQHFVCVNQLWSSPWGYGGSAPGCTKDGLSFMVGKLHILFSLIVVILSFVFFKKSKQHYAIWISSIFLLISICLSLQITQPIWEAIHTMAFFQFPWRFLVMMSFFLSFIGGAVLWFTKNGITNYELRITNKNFIIRYSLFVILLLCILFSYSKFFVPQQIFPITPQELTTKKALSWDTAIAASEYMPNGFAKPKHIASMPTSTFVFNTEQGQVISQEEQTVRALAAVQVSDSTLLHINIAYFPAWHAFIDRTEVNLKKVSKGMNVLVPAGKHQVLVQFEQTTIELFADILSLAGIILLIIGIMLNKLAKSVKRQA